MPSRSRSPSPRKTAPAPSEASLAREQILAGARAHFLTHGFRHVTMDDLATELGMSKKTLYAHFASKLALVEAVVLDKLAEADAQLSAVTGDAKRDLSTVLHQLLACWRQHHEDITPNFMRDMRREAPRILETVEQKRAEMVRRHFGGLIGRGQRAGMLRKDIPSAIIVEILLAATQAIVHPQRIEQWDLTPQGAYTTVVHIVLEGALSSRQSSTAKRKK